VWTLFASLTFRELPNDVAALRALVLWLRWIAAFCKCHVTYTWSGDRERLSGSHFHVLLNVPCPLSRAEVRLVQLVWARLHGFAVVARYDERRNGAAYLLSHSEWDVGVACPRVKPDCRRPRGCREARARWA
jgi:hypothetical protein